MSKHRDMPEGHRWRFYVPAGCLKAGPLALDADESHFARVLRLRPGESVEVGDGAGSVASGRITDVGHDVVCVDLDPAHHSAGPRLPVSLVLGLAKQAALEEACESAAQLGATDVLFLETSGSPRHAGAERGLRPRDVERLRRIVRESCRIAKRPWLCKLDPAPKGPAELVQQAAAQRAALVVCDEAPLHSPRMQNQAVDGHVHLVDHLRKLLAPGRNPQDVPQGLMILIGPEAGLWPEDKTSLVQLSAAHGVPMHFVSLGDRILRVPNAARAALVLAEAAVMLA